LPTTASTTICLPSPTAAADSTFGQGPYVINTYAATTDPNDFSFDRVTRQVWGGGVIDLVYLPLAPVAENEFASTRTIVNDRVGNVREYFYDQRNRLVLEREYTGRADPGQPTTEAQNRPLQRLRSDDPAFFETRHVWNSESLLRMTVHPRGNKTIYTYEADLDANAAQRTKGNLREIRRVPLTNDLVTPALNGQSIIIEQFQYDSQFAGGGCCGYNFVTAHIDGRGNVTRHAYDLRGNRIRTQHRIPSIVELFEYNEFGQMTAHVHPDNGSGHRRRDEFTYYTNGVQRGYLHRQIVDAANLALTTTNEYDLVGNVMRVTDPRGHDKRFVLNQLDQVVREISAEVLDGSGIRYTNDFFYDANNNLVRTEIQNRGDLESGAGVPPANPTWTTTFEYEILNRLVRKSEEIGNCSGRFGFLGQEWASV
jgi:YD repeat-containing protein